MKALKNDGTVLRNALGEQKSQLELMYDETLFTL